MFFKPLTAQVRGAGRAQCAASDTPAHLLFTTSTWRPPGRRQTVPSCRPSGSPGLRPRSSPHRNVAARKAVPVARPSLEQTRRGSPGPGPAAVHPARLPGRASRGAPPRARGPACRGPHARPAPRRPIRRAGSAPAPLCNPAVGPARARTSGPSNPSFRQLSQGPSDTPQTASAWRHGCGRELQHTFTPVEHERDNALLCPPRSRRREGGLTGLWPRAPGSPS